MTMLFPDEVDDRADDLLHAAVRDRAYRIWEEEGRPEGRAMEHWVRAECEVLDRPWLG
jgi:hypothetical protein